jgi:hypothetical protein
MHDYEQMVKDASMELATLEGQLLFRLLVQEVEPEFNVLYLLTDGGAYAIQGRIGGEVLEIVLMDQPPAEGPWPDSCLVVVKPLAPFALFEGRRIVQARSIGCAWNGHGFEFSFEGLPSRTLLVQSIYTGSKPDGYEDCLRLGIGSYVFDTESGASDLFFTAEKREESYRQDRRDF